MARPALPFRALICDMDGTLYESAGEIDDYARRVRLAVPAERRTSFWSDWGLVRRGRHPIQVGRVYDDRLDWVLAVVDGRPRSAWALLSGEGSWREVGEAELLREFPPGVTVAPPGEPDARAPDAIRWVPIGDAWWLPPCLARHHGAAWEAVEAAYVAAREAMVGAEFRAEPLPGLAEVLAALRELGVHLVLATNTPRDTGEPFLARLGLGRLFDEVVFDAGKPEGLVALIERVCRARGLRPREVACVGDNWVNDVEPGVRLGCPAMLIDRYGVLGDGRGAAGGDGPWPRLVVHPSARSWVEWLRDRLAGLDGGEAP
ncbi:MAG: HAD family hydrolase [Clostridia bacterium]|nr:HAD family hydrolase [Clostridia bacterium]